MINELFNKLVEKYNLRAIRIDDEDWYGINDLPMNTRDNLSRLNSNGLSVFVKSNTRTIKPSDISNVCSTDIRNFDTIANRGETFGNFTMVNYLVMNSRLGPEYKIELIEILDKIRNQGYYISSNITLEQLENAQVELSEMKAKYETYGIKGNTLNDVASATGKARKKIEQWCWQQGWYEPKYDDVIIYRPEYVVRTRKGAIEFTPEGLLLVIKGNIKQKGISILEKCKEVV